MLRDFRIGGFDFAADESSVRGILLSPSLARKKITGSRAEHAVRCAPRSSPGGNKSAAAKAP